VISVGEIGHQRDIDKNIDMGYGIWDIDLGYSMSTWLFRSGIWADDMVDDSIDMVILRIDMGSV